MGVHPAPAGASATLTTTYLVPALGLTREFYASADPPNSIGEANEAEQRGPPGRGGADLEVTSVAPEYWGGLAVGLRSAIRNAGTTVAPTSTLAFYLAGGSSPVVTGTIPALIAGQAAVFATPWNLGGLPAGPQTLRASANPGDFAETLRANNVYTFTVALQPDLMVSAHDVQAVAAGGGMTAITATLYNIGPARPRMRWWASTASRRWTTAVCASRARCRCWRRGRPYRWAAAASPGWPAASTCWPIRSGR